MTNGHADETTINHDDHHRFYLSSPKSHIDLLMREHSRINDDKSVFSVCLICLTIAVSICCSVAGFIIHSSVKWAGCLGGLNGCHESVLLDAVKPSGISTSVFFILSCGLSGLLCSLIIYSPFQGGIARRCKGGGSAETKIMISSGAKVNGWVVVLRIVLATLYMGGGNPLGTEGPIVHLSTSLATWMVSKYAHGKKRQKKLLSTFGVIGSAAGISAGFNVLITGFVYVIEEIARTLSGKLALILAFAAGVAFFIKDLLTESLHNYLPKGHASLVPDRSHWEHMTDADWRWCLLLCLPIGVLAGVSGWIFTHTTWELLLFLNPILVGRRPSWIRRVLLPEWSHLAIAGVIVGCVGAVAYEVTGMNGVWGTTVGAVPEAIEKGLGWEKVLLLFALKFIAFILATAAGGPGGLLVPSIVTGGYLGLFVGRLVGSNDDICSACAVIGMGSMFSAVMHLPLTGVIIIFELTRADKLSLHIALSSFIASNVVCRLPHGSHSYVHRQLEVNETWEKLGHRNFIETDLQETDTDVALFKSTIAVWLMSDSERLRQSFHAWRAVIKGVEFEGVSIDLQSLKNMSRQNTPSEDLEEGSGGPGSPRRTVSLYSLRSRVSTKSVDLDSGPLSRGDTPSDVKRKQREMWENVSNVIPGLHWRLWKSFTSDQRLAITEAAAAMKTATIYVDQQPASPTSGVTKPLHLRTVLSSGMELPERTISNGSGLISNGSGISLSSSKDRRLTAAINILKNTVREESEPESQEEKVALDKVIVAISELSETQLEKPEVPGSPVNKLAMGLGNGKDPNFCGVLEVFEEDVLTRQETGDTKLSL